MPTLAPRSVRRPAPGTCCARRVELARQPIEVVDEVVRPLAVERLLVVAGAAGEVRRHAGAGQRPVGNAVAVDVLVAAPVADARQRLGVEHLAAIERLGRVLERVGHPGVHAEVEIAHHEDGRLQALGEVEGVLRHLVALGDGRRQQEDVAAVAVRQAGGEGDVLLRGAGRQAGRRADALDVEDHRRQLGVVGQAGELGHQRDARAGGRASSSGRPPTTRRPPCRARRSRPRPGPRRSSPCRSPCRCGTCAGSRSASRTATTTA